MNRDAAANDPASRGWPGDATSGGIVDGRAVKPPTRWLHYYACLLIAATIILIAAGGMVTSTGSGLSVPDWPTTYGYNMFTFPVSRWVGGIFYEHGHRLIASTVGLMTILLAVWIQKRERRHWVRRLAWTALAVVVLQGILGGLTVRYLLPAPISIFHACLAQIFLGLLVTLAAALSPTWRSLTHAAAAGGTPRPRRLGILCVGVIFVQLVLGAAMRHTGSGLAVPDFPLAYGQVLPELSRDAVAEYNHVRAWDYPELNLAPVTAGQIVTHVLHRYWSLVVLISAFCLIVSVNRHLPEGSPGRSSASLVMVLLMAQFGLGAWTILSGRLPVAATLHVAVGAAILALVWHTTLLALPTRLSPVASSGGAASGNAET